MEDLSNISVIREILGRHGFRFSHSLGQNFLTNPTVSVRMAEMCGTGKEICALEIGPGIGVLTRELALRSCKVAALEIDKRLLPVLEETLAGFKNVHVIEADAMKTDLKKLLAEEFGGREAVVCANLPYYITSPLIMSLLESRLPISAVTVMVQKEAAQRLCAKPGERACGAVSAAVRYFSEPQMLFEVSRGNFMPSPHVDSAVIRLNIRKDPPVELTSESAFFELIRLSFGQRRKILVNAASSSGKYSKEELKNALTVTGISQEARAEQLTLADFAALSNCLLREKKDG